MSRYGRYQVPEPPSALLSLHAHAGGGLKPVDHEPKMGVLDQQNLLAQGIRVSEFIPGAQDVDALGSCTANATTVALSNVLDRDVFALFIRDLGRVDGDLAVYVATAAAERAAIGFYHRCTDQTGNPGQEWPPTDCGSSGPYIVSELEALKLITGQRIAHGADNLVSLMQRDGVLMGSPWLNAWEEPTPDGFIDGDGSASTLQRQIGLGIAGGHETYLCAVEKLVVSPAGHVDPYRTILRGRNSWSASWGDHGCYRVHLSTLVTLGGHCDFRQIRA